MMKLTKDQVSAVASKILRDAKQKVEKESKQEKYNEEATKKALKDWQLYEQLSELFKDEYIGRLTQKKVYEMHAENLSQNHKEKVYFKSHSDVIDDVILAAMSSNTLEEIENKVKAVQQ